jgi:beta-xylosidase
MYGGECSTNVRTYKKLGRIKYGRTTSIAKQVWEAGEWPPETWHGLFPVEIKENRNIVSNINAFHTLVLKINLIETVFFVFDGF